MPVVAYHMFGERAHGHGAVIQSFHSGDVALKMIVSPKM